MTRVIKSRKIIDLGKASAQTKGGLAGAVDFSGKQPIGGLTND